MSQNISASRRETLPTFTMYTPLIALLIPCCIAFTSISRSNIPITSYHPIPTPHKNDVIRSTSTVTSTSLPMVWFFGTGASNSETTVSTVDNEMVEVRIDRLSSNSRRIGGEIIVEAPIDDVWAILTDYDNLSTHVPNLVDSRRVRRGRGTLQDSHLQNARGNVQGDGRYKCRLYQRGAQNIIGFDFSASVTMDMAEQIVRSDTSDMYSDELEAYDRRINFKCVESQFFSEFDGEWKVVSNPDDNGASTTVSYVVDVRPKGPVPVAALEWRIREDVPTNLRAVKKAAMEVGLEGVLALRARTQGGAVSRALSKINRERTNIGDELNDRRVAAEGATRVAIRNGTNTVKGIIGRLPQQTGGKQLAPVRVPVKWDDDETMAAYLNNK